MISVTNKLTYLLSNDLNIKYSSFIIYLHNNNNDCLKIMFD